MASSPCCRTLDWDGVRCAEDDAGAVDGPVPGQIPEDVRRTFARHWSACGSPVYSLIGCCGVA